MHKRECFTVKIVESKSVKRGLIMTGIISASPIDVDTIMTALYRRRTVFCSEADFQHEFAKQIQMTYGFQVRCEFPVTINDQKAQIDILAIKDNNCAIAIELKYKTKEATVIDKGTEGLGLAYDLKGHDAQNDGSYNYIYDIYRLESLKNSEKILVHANEVEAEDSINIHYNGEVFCHAIFLTNDLKYPNIITDTRKTYKYFNGRSISNGSSSTLNVGDYKFDWNTYPDKNPRVSIRQLTPCGPWQLVDKAGAPHVIPDEFVYVNTII